MFGGAYVQGCGGGWVGLGVYVIGVKLGHLYVIHHLIGDIPANGISYLRLERAPLRDSTSPKGEKNLFLDFFGTSPLLHSRG